MKRAEHLQWAKDRAIEFIDTGDDTKAFTSFMVDMGAHKDLQNHMALNILNVMFIRGFLKGDSLKKYIKDFN